MRVLLATDGSEPAMRACQGIGYLLVPGRDHVRLITILSYSLYPQSLIPDMPLSGEKEMERHEVEEVARLTDEPRRALEGIGLHVEVTHRFGNPADEIVGEIEEWKPDLVVLGRRGVRGLERWIGSVSEHSFITRRSRCYWFLRAFICLCLKCTSSVRARSVLTRPWASSGKTPYPSRHRATRNPESRESPIVRRRRQAVRCIRSMLAHGSPQTSPRITRVGTI